MQTPVPTLPFSLSLSLPSFRCARWFGIVRKCLSTSRSKMLPDNYSGSKFDARKPSVTSSVRHHHRRRRRQEKEREKHANRFDSNRIVSLSLSNKSLSSKLCRSAQRGDAKINKRRRQTTKKALFFDATTRAKRKRTRKALLFRRKRRTT